MNAPAPGEAVEAPQASCTDAAIAALQSAGAERFDPVRWRYIEALSRRAAVHEGQARRLLDARLALALAALKERFALARGEARQALAQAAQQFPAVAADLQRHVDSGDFKQLQQSIANLKAREQCASLAALVRTLEAASEENAPARPAADNKPPVELKTIRNSRNTWSRLSIEKQLARALEQSPKNAGPINSHMLVLRSLAAMRDISPDYLNRFMSYAETLLSLDLSENEKPASARKPQAAKPAKKSVGK